MTSKVGHFGEQYHVVTFDKSQREYYAKLSKFHSQFRMVGNRSALRILCQQRTIIKH